MGKRPHGVGGPLPPGVVTFLLTDIEGSSKLWEHHPHTMGAALARHDTLLRATIAAHQGTIIKTGGDGFIAVFPHPSAALTAALAIQRTLLAEPWGETGPLRVRMALHTGPASPGAGDYAGSTLNRVNRLGPAAHGGQVLLSQATYTALAGQLPPDVTLQPLGEHRLQDLDRPETIYQLVAPDLPPDFPPLRTLEAFAHNLPIQTTSFVGRERELAELKAAFWPPAPQGPPRRLVTLTGVGGTGKTRLGLQVGADLLHRYPNGVWLVELAALTDPSLVPQAVAAVLGVVEEPGRPLLTTLVRVLQPKTLLLILDNCEHLIDACAHLADALLRGCPHLHLLASSREALGIAGEMAWPVPSLALPPLPAQTTPAREAFGELLRATMIQSEAVQLFMDRAVAALPSFALTSANAPAVLEVCRRLDGIPLALELAAARVNTLPVETLAARLDDRFRLLAGSGRAALPRQQTLEALIDWSYDMLAPAERLLFSRLSVFQGGWTLEAAEMVCAGDGIDLGDIFDLLMQLVNKSLVVAEHHGAQTRYRLLETIRQYARDKLFEGGIAAAQTYRDRHLDYFAHLAETAWPHIQGPDYAPWLAILEAEHDNARAALEWATLSSARPSAEAPALLTAGLRLAWGWSALWWPRGHQREGYERLIRLLDQVEGQVEGQAEGMKATVWYGRCLNLAGALANFLGELDRARPFLQAGLAIGQSSGDTGVIVAALINLGNVAWMQGDYITATPFLEQAVDLARAAGPPDLLANSLGWLGHLYRMQGHPAKARPVLEESLTLFRQLGNPQGIGDALRRLGILCAVERDFVPMQAYIEESLAVRRTMGDKGGIAFALNMLGEVARGQGNFAEAEAFYQESLALLRDLGNPWNIAMVCHNIGWALYHQNNPAAARPYFHESLLIDQEINNPRGIAENLAGVAALAHDAHQPTEATILLSASAAILSLTGVVRDPMDATEYDQLVASVQSELDPAAFQSAWDHGQTLTPAAALSFAVTLLSSHENEHASALSSTASSEDQP